MKAIHYGPTGEAKSVCGRNNPAHLTSITFRVTCNSCISRNSFQEDHQKAVLAKEQAFLARTPEPARGQFDTEDIVCTECGGVLFRQGDRSCYGHYDNFHCDECGHVTQRITETGMSF